MGGGVRVLQHQATFSTAGGPHLLWGGTLQSPSLPTEESGGEILGSFSLLRGFWGQAFFSDPHSEQQSLAYVHFFCL